MKFHKLLSILAITILLASPCQAFTPKLSLKGVHFSEPVSISFNTPVTPRFLGLAGWSPEFTVGIASDSGIDLSWSYTPPWRTRGEIEQGKEKLTLLGAEFKPDTSIQISTSFAVHRLGLKANRIPFSPLRPLFMLESWSLKTELEQANEGKAPLMAEQSSRYFLAGAGLVIGTWINHYTEIQALVAGTFSRRAQGFFLDASMAMHGAIVPQRLNGEATMGWRFQQTGFNEDFGAVTIRNGGPYLEVGMRF